MAYTDKQLKEALPHNYGYAPIYRLRWRFEFADRMTKIGGWNNCSQNPKEMAAFVDKKKLVMAIIEGERISSWGIKTLLEVEGHNYASMQWVTCLSCPMHLNGPQHTKYVQAGDVIGLSILTASHKATVFVDGRGEYRTLTDQEKKFKIYEHRS